MTTALKNVIRQGAVKWVIKYAYLNLTPNQKTVLSKYPNRVRSAAAASVCVYRISRSGAWGVQRAGEMPDKEDLEINMAAYVCLPPSAFSRIVFVSGLRKC